MFETYPTSRLDSQCTTEEVHWDSPESLAKAARHLASRGHMKRAETILLSGFFEHPDSALLAGELGELYFIAGQDKEAAEFYQMALELNPCEVTVILRIALLFFRNGKFDEAAEIASAVSYIDPVHTLEAFLLEADAHRLAGRHEKALDLYARILEKCPGEKDILDRIKKVQKNVLSH